ncbi:MAG: NAD(P)-dependent oxidoreductase [Acidobacteriota bacterium]
MKQKIGFIGMGIMGIPMAQNVLKAGYPTVVYNRTECKCGELTPFGAETACSPKELVEKADIIVAMLTGPEAIDAVLWGENGGAAALDANKTFINMSSVSPAYTRELDQKIRKTGTVFIDAPVSGSKKPAEDATLLILAGGPKEKVDDLTPLLLTMGKKVIYCGEAGQGSMAKMANNLLLGLMLSGFCETMNFGLKGGLDMETLFDIVLSGPLNAPIFQMKTGMVKNDEYPANFPLKHMRKDLKFLVDTACETGSPIPLGLTLLHLYTLGVEHKCGDMDVAAIMKVMRHLNG